MLIALKVLHFWDPKTDTYKYILAFWEINNNLSYAPPVQHLYFYVVGRCCSWPIEKLLLG